MKISPLKELFLGALLWLPLCFFLWFWLASPIVFPVSVLVDGIMTGLFPELIHQVRQFGYLFEVQTGLAPGVAPAGNPGGTPVLVLQLNPMVYAYGLPLLAGLVMATPVSARRRAVQILGGFMILIPVQVWGVSWEILKIIGFDLGPQGVQALQAAGLNLELVALCYQFGYLIFPAVTPVVVWILWNRRFLETLVRRDPGPERPADKRKERKTAD